jgi:flagellar hook-length control protein FliK
MKSPSMGSLLSQGKANDDDLIMQRLAALNDENARLRRSLVAQINQRAYFQEEYRRAQTRCAAALLESHTFHEDNTVLQRRAKELASLIEVHERTNEALQEQLADAYNDDTGGKEQGRRMRDTINRLGAELETERMHHKALRSELDQRETSEATAIEQLKSQLAELRECETLWADRIKMLQEQLKLANSLKEEYKRRLKSSSPDPSE